jgi:hypothetical protein
LIKFTVTIEAFKAIRGTLSLGSGMGNIALAEASAGAAVCLRY